MLVRKELLSPEWAERILSWPHSGFNVHSLVRAKTKIEAEREGDKGLAHGNRGKPSPKRLAEPLVERIVTLVRERYRDFKPKFAAEKLWKREKIKVSDEKMRQIMISARLWHVRRHKSEVHPWREPKAYCGEMVQMGGSHHAWLEARGSKLVLMGMVDDARNRFYGRFYAYEGVFPAMNVLEGYLIRWKGRRFAIEEPTRRMLGRPATVMLHFDGRMIIRYEGRDLGYREIAERPKRVPAVPIVRPKPPRYTPPPTHPWKVYQGPAASDTPVRP